MTKEAEAEQQAPVVIIGGGPAGLGSAYELLKLGRKPLVLERLDKVGGIARTESFEGYRFDLGGHRFYTKSHEVQDIWEEILGDEFLLRPRLSRIYYRHRFFRYPLKLGNTLMGLGPMESLKIGLSYLRWRAFPSRREDTFEQWVVNRFGRRLFRTFFKSYTEKVWGIPCGTLKAEWAAQRIKDLSLWTALMSMFRNSEQKIRTLTETFHYPRLGPGMLWERMAEMIGKQGGEVRLNADVEAIQRDGQRITSVRLRGDGQAELTLEADHFVSSMPVSRLVKILQPAAPKHVLHAADSLNYRDFLTVCLIVEGDDLFPDNWIYIHDADVRVGRIQNFKNWSPDMVPTPGTCSLGLEYFCNAGDELWNCDDADLIDQAKLEIEKVGLARSADVRSGCVVRVNDAYPVYDSDYRDHLATVREFVDGLENLHTIGRNGLHRYNNQDHSMLTGMLAARDIALGEKHDLWEVNTDREYHEEVRTEPDELDIITEVLPQVFARVHRSALGLATGLIGGALLAFVTYLVSKWPKGEIQIMVELLGQFFPGYSVSPEGIGLGLAYGFVSGFALGWSFALLRNGAVFLHMVFIQRRMEQRMLRNLLDML
ncbi:MAG: NAD(P)/FAD-dependent oxidoreductase [Gammaproteobacteria bacterium]